MTYKVFQWASGGVGAPCLNATLNRDSLELVGLHVFSDSKVGMDAGELIKREPVGVKATNSIDAIIASNADVVLHTPLPSLIVGENPDQDVDDICALLAGGKNVITVVGYMYPKVHGPALVNRLEEACRAGNSSFHSTGLNPGWLGDLIPLTMSALCERVDHVHVLEVTNFQGFPSPEVMFDSMSFAATPEEFDKRNARQARWLNALFSESVQMVADGMNLGVTDVVTEMETELASSDLKVAAGTVPAGTVAGQHWQWIGRDANGKDRIAHETVWRIHPDVAPHWADGANTITLQGSPSVSLDFPGNFSFISGDNNATSMHAINAIPYVVDAEPGIKTFLDLPRITCQQ